MPAPPWDSRYPSPDLLRRETEAMADAFLDALFEVYPPEAVRYVTAKGSSRKPWDSPIDYVPELSDVDIHVLFAAAPDPSRPYISLDQGLQMQESLERGFRRRIPVPIHVPRIQFIPANVLEQAPLYVPSPPSTVHVLYGELNARADIDPEMSRSSARSLLLDFRPYLSQMGEQVAEKSARHLWDMLRQLTWRVAPAGPRVLEVIGVPYDEAWGANRSVVVRLLADAGQGQLANAYTSFYLNEWGFFLSGYGDAAAAREAVRSAAQVLQLSAAVAEAS